MSCIYFALNLAAAIALGSLIGTERQRRQRMAGLRTNALVATGAAVFVMLAMPVSDNSIRVAAQVVGDRLSRRWRDHARRLYGSRTQHGRHVMVLGCGWNALRLGSAQAGAIGTAGVLLANFGLRPLARLIDRQPSEPDTSTGITY
jgi:putative Mg2+ transporter-C (MgtC) family protein